MTRSTYDAMAWALLVAAVVTAIALIFVVAPYGRHARPGWGPTLSSRLGWMLMESPSLFLFTAVYFGGSKHGEPAPLLLWAMWVAHYTHRTLIYPLRMKSEKRMPLLIVGLALVFNVTNATMNASWISELGSYPRDWVVGPRFLVGVALFAFGMAVNLDADRRLFALRKPGDTQYAIPRGGLFEWSSCPNYLGEIVEWTGWAIASWSLGGAAFALYTVANLAPRAASHHVWMRRSVVDYPTRRKALVPFIW